VQAIVLASTSRYRAQLLRRLGLPFTTANPGTDETPEPNESPADLATRLAHAKAVAVRDKHPSAIIIGSDQVPALAGSALSKPGTVERAQEQLALMSGQSVSFYTGLCVLNSADEICSLDETRVRMRTLNTAEIERYVAVEQPLDCAGSFKVEGLGISLFDSVESTDPTALIGLPLISVANALRRFGVSIP